MKKINYFILIILILIFMTATVTADEFELDFEYNLNNIDRQNNYDLDNKKLFVPEFNVRGIYVSGWAAGTENKMNYLINFVERTILNTMVIDIKDVQGIISYDSKIPLALEIGAPGEKIKDIAALIKLLKQKGIYVIGRIAVFKDPLLATKFPAYALTLEKDGKQPYRSKEWVSPGQDEVIKYNIALAREAITIGFDEIQFDYIRFPALARKPEKVVLERESLKSELINNFLREVKQEFASVGVPISIDVYGLTTSSSDDMGIGQNFVQMSKYVDIISPMVYPSHYADGCYGIEIPDLEPYRTVHRSIYDAKEKVKGKNNIRIRPWLQDFSLKNKYTAEEVKAQIRAVEEQGIKEWLLWNPSSQYTEDALLPSYKINIQFK